MAEVDIVVAGRTYRLACDDGQEGRLAAVGAAIDAQARGIASQLGVIGEARLMLMTAVMMADQLADAQDAAKAARAEARQPAPAEAPPLEGPDAGAALRGAVSRLEDLLAAHERPGDPA